MKPTVFWWENTRPFVLGVLILIPAGFALWYWHLAQEDYVFTQITGRAVQALELSPGKQIRQTFTASQANLTGISLKFGTYARNNNCNISVVVDEGDTVIHQTVFNARTLIDNAFHPIEFAPRANSEGKTYTITITTDAVSGGETAAVWLGFHKFNRDNPKRPFLFVNGAPDKHTICMQSIYAATQPLLYYVIHWLSIMVVSLAAFALIF